ncbi:DUF72 domain-containing protein [Paenibacillus sp. JX-17]|uniref:DUF72 domain-containing protein n=1 Tax=Paenibacillus lacisoli TaxID=3064525 RepID=A0ABT9CCE6_9BACL|nr:DUF72 domain-containing protein [Paenibacillus sp. JX-17]MDO7906933.1 DUF72 domain-containing protein [Paenibacillus sp. JX-17]
MPHIGLTGWGDHEDLYPAGTKPKNMLGIYSSYFTVVEVDSSFYAVQPRDRMARWVSETPGEFQFIVKAYQGMTGHLRGKPYFSNDDDMYTAFLESIKPMREAGKLQAVLFQYPPWFDCTREHVALLRETRRRMGDIRCALEFRHQSWFSDAFKTRTLQFMRDERWIHSICDEPQVSPGSVPTVLEATDPDLTIVRLHGRNASGWQQNGAENWREVRYLYRYDEAELEDWRQNLLQLSGQSREVSVIFNNNSGGDAAANATRLMAMLGQNPKPLVPPDSTQGEEPPEQLSLF